MSEYYYNLIIVNENDEVEILSGLSQETDPRAAARSIVERETDWCDQFGADLEPTIEIERDSDGNFVVDVDSHGLGKAGLVLTKV